MGLSETPERTTIVEWYGRDHLPAELTQTEGFGLEVVYRGNFNALIPPALLDDFVAGYCRGKAHILGARNAAYDERQGNRQAQEKTAHPEHVADPDGRV